MIDPEAHRTALLLAQAARETKAVDIVLIAVGELTHLAHYFLICHGTSDRHCRAIAERVERDGKAGGAALHHREGEQTARWILLDFSDVVVHIFDEPTREKYRLEDLWADAPRVALDVVA